MKKKKSRRPPVDLDAMKLAVIEIDEAEANELRGVVIDDRPISEIAMKMAAEMKIGKKLEVRVASTGMVLTTRRLLMDDLERIVRGTELMPLCVEHGTQLIFSYGKRY